GFLLSKSHFAELVSYAQDYLHTNSNVTVEANPSGFYRIRLPIPKGFFLEKKMEALRLHYWPPGTKLNMVEALHDHPNYFESMILNGGYTHSVYRHAKDDESGESFRLHRILKAFGNPEERNPLERNIFSLGMVKLINLGEEMVSENFTVRFPKSLIHQVLTYQP